MQCDQIRYTNERTAELDLVSRIEPKTLRLQIRGFRHRLRNEPRNAVLWAEAARVYAILGATSAAQRSMRIALALAPNNRFILRAAVRLALHYDNCDEALDILRKAEATRHDPWLVSAIARESEARIHRSALEVLRLRFEG